MNSRTVHFGNRFADYFVICGLDEKSGLEPDRFNEESLQYNPLERSYKTKVLAHYPENVPWNPFDQDAVCMLCLPSGLQFRTQEHSLEPSFHCFVITREDGSRSYGFSYVVYEEVQNRRITSAMQTLQAMHLTEMSSSRRGKGHHSRRGGGSSEDGPNTRSLPRHFKLSTPQQGVTQSYYDFKKDTLYVSKSIALISQLPYVFAARKFLESLHKRNTSPSDKKLNLESYVHNLLYEVPIPQPGRSVQFSCFCEGQEECETIVIQRPSSIEELPMFDFPLREMFCLLGMEHVIQLFTCVLLEHQVLLCSTDFQRLMLVAECITCLLFPFTWQHVYVPILPASLQHFLDAPVPFVMGLHSCKSHVKIASEGDLCYVNIDNRRIQLPEELPSFPQQEDLTSELTALFKKNNISLGELESKLPHTYTSKFRNEDPADLMTRSCNLSSNSQFNRKHSWSYDSNSLFSDVPGLMGSDSPLSLSHSDAMQKVVAILRRTGVSLDGADGNSNTQEYDVKKNDKEQYIEDLRFNIAIREIFFNHFVHIFSAYEHFVIVPNQNREEWLSNRDSVQNFDKAAFLSDQPDKHLPFLSRFIESQMFATLIDNKILSTWTDIDPYLRVFDRRIDIHRKRLNEGLVRSPNYDLHTTIRDSQMLLEKRFANIDILVPPPREIQHQKGCQDSQNNSECFPLLNSICLKEPCRFLKHSRKGKGKSKHPHYFRRENSCPSDGCILKSTEITEAQDSNTAFSLTQGNGLGTVSLSNLRQPKLSTDISPAQIAETNWKFVEKLLSDCKSKTKRMLVEKMGSEAVELGHGGEIVVVGVEENTLIASLCDLLEKIWSHRLQQKQGKSGLWSHLTSYIEMGNCSVASQPVATQFPAQQIHLHYPIPGSVDPRTTLDPKAVERRIEQPVLQPLPVSLVTDLRHIQAMSDIKTHIGYARAWVRLALEKKLLSTHLRSLLDDTSLLRSLYKRSSFLRSEDEKEQFLCHLLTLNAVDYYCFTNTYTKTRIMYRILFFPSRKLGSATTSANAWISVSGTLGETTAISIPSGFLEFVFSHQNLGILTSVCVGHDNSGPSPNWLLEHVIVRNETTGHTYKFPCGRWLGRGIDDGSTERLLVGELVPHDVASEELIESCRTPPRSQSPCVPRKSSSNRPSRLDVRDMLGDAVNRIVKFFYKKKHEKDRSTLMLLLCGEKGLVYCLEQVFLCGFKSSRFFGRDLYLWDFLVRVKEQFETNQVECVHIQSQKYKSTSSCKNEAKCDCLSQDVMQAYCILIDQITGSSHTLGKDGKFQLMVCLCARNHLLNRIIPCIAAAKVTVDMYEEESFLRDPSSVLYLKQLLSNLNDFDIVLEHSLTKGLGE